MISITEAINIVKQTTSPLNVVVSKAVEKAGGYLLAEDVLSPINMPPFRQSAMDGYALALHEGITYKFIGEIKAGDGLNPDLKPGDAVRIFTGAAVPDSANAVVMQEKVKKTNNTTIVLDHEIPVEQNIRPMGEQVKAGHVALKKGTKLTPAGIGYLLSLGITKVDVFKKPNIAIVTTGNELITPGKDLTYGKIYESNSKMLLSTLYSLKFYDITCYTVKDDFNSTKATLDKAITANDVVLITGGISVGDYDFVGKALIDLKVTEHFYKVKQKPGKPLFYGQKENTQIFALPGNPAAALTCFYVYVYVALQQLMDRSDVELPRVSAKAITTFNKRGDRPQFLKGIYANGAIEILDGQNSSMLQTFALANALVFMPGDCNTVEIGDTVETLILPV